MQKLPRSRERQASIKARLRLLFQAPSVAEAKDYRVWQRRFMIRRLRLGFGLAILCFLTFICLQLSDAVLHPELFRWTRLAIHISVVVCLFLGLGLYHSTLCKRHPGRLFLLLSWLVTFSPQIQDTLDRVAMLSIVEWPLMFFAQATLIPVRWYLHIISQFGVFAYYLLSKSVLGFQAVEPVDWMTEQFAFLYFFWICLISNLSVYLNDRLARGQFTARHALETAHHALEDAYAQLKTEQERSDQLLLNILPQPIAERLKREPTTIADSFNNVGVLFGDIAGFTELSGRISPEELVQLLNKIFSRFDALAERHGLEKIKTIGDAYMVVSGLPIAHDDYAAAIVDMALDMKQALQEFNLETGQNLQMRIGIAVGPVIAGVIGIKKFIYDLWGDTVNVASRMESHGIIGEIQVTDEIYKSLKEGYLFESRGKIYVKGKGEMTTYLLKQKIYSNKS
ncbi:MAG: adenylate/guanylate cyclase domain-containing protein [Microcoleaceae cyanobacterium]